MTYKSSTLRCAPLLWLIFTLGCIVREPGTGVEIEVTTMSHAPSAARSDLTTDQDYRVQLNQFYLVLSRVELVPCTSTHNVSVLRELFGVSIAHAHGKNSSTAWAVPNVLAPLIDSAPVSIALLHPPATSYCGLRVSLAAADADAERMPTEIDMSGLSMFVTGKYATLDTTPGVDFSYQSYVASVAELPLLDSAGNPTVVTLSEDNLNVRLRIELAYQHSFDGLILFPGSFSSFGDVVLGQMLTHATAIVGEAELAAP